MKKLLMVAFAAALFCALPAKADEIYSYTGNALTGCTGCYVSVTFTLPTALGVSLTDDPVTADVTSFTFSDNNGDTVSNTDPTLYSDDFEFWTSDTGAITEWDMYGCDYAGGPDLFCIGTENEPGTYVSDYSQYFFLGLYPYAGFSNSNDAGNAPAIVGTTAAPESPSWLFLAFGLLAVGLLHWRRTNATRLVPASLGTKC